MIGEARLDDRKEQPYVAIRSQVPIGELPSVIPQAIDDVAAWLQEQGIDPAGPPLARYHACPTTPEQSALVDIAVGWPVVAPLTGAGRIVAGVLPAGRYASLVFTGVENGIPGNAALIEWAAAQGIEWDHWQEAIGDAFAGRVEYMLDGPDDDPNPSNWKTEVAIKLADQ